MSSASDRSAPDSRKRQFLPEWRLKGGPSFLLLLHNVSFRLFLWLFGVILRIPRSVLEVSCEVFIRIYFEHVWWLWTLCVVVISLVMWHSCGFVYQQQIWWFWPCTVCGKLMMLAWWHHPSALCSPEACSVRGLLGGCVGMLLRIFTPRWKDLQVLIFRIRSLRFLMW